METSSQGAFHLCFGTTASDVGGDRKRKRTRGPWVMSQPSMLARRTMPMVVLGIFLKLSLWKSQTVVAPYQVFIASTIKSAPDLGFCFKKCFHFVYKDLPAFSLGIACPSFSAIPQNFNPQIKNKSENIRFHCEHLIPITRVVMRVFFLNTINYEKIRQGVEARLGDRAHWYQHFFFEIIFFSKADRHIVASFFCTQSKPIIFVFDFSYITLIASQSLKLLTMV